MTEVVHYAHFFDGYPLCWSQDDDGPHTSTRQDSQVTCPDCLGYLQDSNNA